MKWYFCIDWAGAETYAPMIRAAVNSCRAHTELEPICVCYDPEQKFPASLCEFFAANGVKFIRSESRVTRHLRDHAITIENFSMSTASGAYLRFEIPLLETEDEIVLYTDCDVLFRPCFTPPTNRPRYFACAPEFDVNNWSYFNSGVMVMNVPTMRATSEGLLTTALCRLKAGICHYDQGDLNAFYWQAWDHLVPEYNWKPYWGINDHARIVHFHGPKPGNVADILAGRPTFEIYQDLFRNNPDAYHYYVGQFHEALPGD